MLSENDYKKLTDPESVALVGVTSRSGKGSNNPLEVMLEWGYRGKIYPVNPKGGTILGHQAYTSLLDVPEIPDVAVICAPRDAVPELFDQCCTKKVKLVIIVAQGFFDGDERGKSMQKEILKAADKHGVRILGPNTLGVVNNFNRFCTSFMRFMNPTAATGILCQSGVSVVGAPQIFSGIGLLIDTGNTTDIEFSELLGHIVRDPRLKVINLHMESLRDGPQFMRAARDAVALKPVIVYKTGASPDGAITASSHTGALAGEDRVFDTAFKQCGLLRVEDVEEMIDLNKVFTTFNGIKGNRVGVVSISGGAAIIAVDACSRYGLEIAKMSGSTEDQLSELFPAWAHCNNPVDMWPAGMFHGYHNSYRRILEAFMEDPQMDAVICITGSFLDKEGDFLDTTELIREIAGKYPEKPVVAWTYGQRFQDYAREFEKENNVLYFYSIDRAARALSALYRYHHIIKKKDYRPVSTPLNPGQAQAGKILAGKSAGNLSQTDVFRLLESYGIPVARWGKAENIEEAVSLAEKVGYPVAMKVLSPDIIHKSDAGGVRLNIGNARQLEEAFTEMRREIENKQNGARLDGVIIQEHLDKGTELILGCKRDPQFGPVLAFGAGGVFTEVMDDISLRVPPLSEEELTEMIEETKISKILAGARGATAVNLDVLTGCLTKFAQLVLANPAISEMDINPLLAYADRVVALDARITLDR
ncbi:acetate--CoA ligase family protein [Pelotomaculum isophthalicicum JI]|uniref:Acetate--CoA ligase family protein n=1 Tax=Pelotomaculum isophthalicicum JI TaxID=947010 RepID=A0A9X4JV63_9FIRM|nr:acetate--CoA ligase family protein [Pelotomaculum isophthalicicum]MDF9406837.1 acetate--CoA ligase family protein [Pelotomaculum isophthalicicum JI]